MTWRRNWRAPFKNAEGWPAAGFVYFEEELGDRYQSIFLKPFPHNRPPLQSDYEFIGTHRKLSTAKRAVEQYACRGGFTQTGRWD